MSFENGALVLHPETLLPTSVFWEGEFYQLDFQEEQSMDEMGISLLESYLADMREGIDREQALKELIRIMPKDNSVEIIREFAYMQIKRVVAFELMRLPEVQQGLQKCWEHPPVCWLMDRELAY